MEPVSEPKPCARERMFSLRQWWQTYGNMCTMKSAEFELDYDGERLVAEPNRPEQNLNQ